MELSNKEKSIILSHILFAASEGYMPRGIDEKTLINIIGKLGMNERKYTEMVSYYEYDIDKCKVQGL